MNTLIVKMLIRSKIFKCNQYKRMKTNCQYIISILCVICLYSCNKKPDSVHHKGFIKSISSDFEACVKGSLELEDGNYVLVSQDLQQSKPGLMVKIDPQGGVLWKKNLSEKNFSVWKILPLSHQRYATIGVPVHSSTSIMTACIYDFDGNLLSENDISIAPYLVSENPVEAIQLSNGNFAIASSTTLNTSKCFLVITDTAFNKLNTRIISIPDTSHVFSALMGLCEGTDNSIALTAFTYRKVWQGQGSYMVGNQTLWMMRTSMTGVVQTNQLWSDTNYSETPNALISYKDGLLSVSSRMLGFNNSNGVFVSYYGFGDAKISAKINLNRCNASGDIMNRIEISDYPLNGSINSIRKTADGGYILCGTVNQSSDVSLVSKTKIYLLKLNQNLGVEWSRVIQSTYPAIGVDVFETTKGDFLVSGHQRIFNKYYEMLIIKTDPSGNIF